jgi:hypothetical protein
MRRLFLPAVQAQAMKHGSEENPTNTTFPDED